MSTQRRADAGNATDKVDVERLVIPNRISELRRVSEWVRGFALERRLPRDLVYALELSVNEALANIMNYAYRDTAQHDIALELFAQPDALRVHVEDDGEPFNPLALLVEEPPQSLEKSRPTGRGIPLMRNLMDDLQYERREGRNVLIMAMRYVRT